MGAELEMKVTLEVIAGPQAGREFCFDGRDSFLVGRSKDAHFQVAHDDSFFSRRHFVIELLPPRSRLLDLKSRNGVYVNGEKVPCAELRDGDQIKAGTTVFRVQIQQPVPDDVETDFLPSYSAPDLTMVWQQSPVLEIAKQFAGYRIVRLIGRGAVGVVYLGERIVDRHPVAIKQIHHAAPHKAVERFLRETRILGELKHPNIVEFIEVVAAEGGP